MKILQTIKKKFKYILGIAAVALLISQVISPALGINAIGPRFNSLQGDRELFTGLNATKDETVWKDPISGNAGDTFDGLIYYHNGVLDTSAENTRIKVTIPAETTNQSAKLRATISADNAESADGSNTVADTIVDGVVVGPSGLTVNLDKNSTLSLVPGSVKWFPNQNETPGVSQPLPGGQTGAELISTNGLNIGTINGCWNFAGFVTFQFKTTPKVLPGNLEIEKVVRNVSNGENNFIEKTSADQSDTVEFKINIKNTGAGDLANVTTSDQLPTDLNFTDGTLSMTKNGVKTILNSAAYFGTGVGIGTLKPGSENEAIIKFEAKVPAVIPATKTVTNVARAVSGSINVSDDAKVDLVAGVVSIVRSKSAFNKTQMVDATTTPARPGDLIEYTLNTKNTGTIAKAVVIKDGIGDVLEESEIISISDGGSIINGTSNNNDSKIVTWPSTSIEPGENVVRKFVVKVMDPLPTNPANGVHFDDKMFNSYGNNVLVVITRPHKAPVLTIDKTVRNVTRNDLTYVKSNTAFPGDMLEYKIDFANTGNAPADRAVVSDVLPANVSLDTTASAVISMDGVERSITEDITKGYLIDTIAAGQSGYVRFRVITSGNIAAGEHLVNTGFITDEGKSISSTADTVILTQVVQASVGTSLPKTGAAAGGAISILGALFAGVNMTYLKQKKLIAKASRIIAS